MGESKLSSRSSSALTSLAEVDEALPLVKQLHYGVLRSSVGFEARRLLAAASVDALSVDRGFDGSGIGELRGCDTTGRQTVGSGRTDLRSSRDPS